MVVAKESDVIECMIHTVGEQIQGNKTRTLEIGGRESAKRRGGGGAGQTGQHKLSSLGQGPTMSPGSRERSVI